LRIVVAPGRDDELEVQIEWRGAPYGAFFPDSGSTGQTAVVALRRLSLSGGLGAHKWADRTLLDAAQANLPADTLPLIVDDDGTVLEASRANVFAVAGGTLLTPPADGRILPGITRARTMVLAAAAGTTTREAQLTRDDLLAADEVFLTGSVRGVELVAALDGRPLSNDGEIASRLAGELRRTWISGRVG
jgi:para-aminobenzoate synthetase/4-amino-4-deoxychorismate lyase